ncbi:MAG TPA: cbb3-type cytochrome c oxidase subunit I, partial [Thermoanaerobaculia bacterium]|nr:cbb3-type cytochrome c oxidase subunit I [Thermoanaerobaculia bacterium]
MTDLVADFAPPEPRQAEGTAGSYLDSHGRGLSEWIFTTDHKRIAILYAVMLTAFFFIGGIAAGLIRLELASPTPTFLTDDGYNRVFTLHGVIMVWFFLVPLIPTTLGNFLLPLMIGAPDVAFPKLNLASWYLTAIGGFFVLGATLMGGVDTGWTFYPPYSTVYSHSNVPIAAIGVIVAGFGTIATAVNFISTTHMLRAPGMTWFRLPLMVWGIYATSVVMVLATPVLAMTLILIVADRWFGLPIFDAFRGGDPLLFQHLFWFYS